MHIIVIFINIGSYHAARLKAAYKMCQSLGWQFTAIQVTDDTLEHSWGDFVGSLEVPVKTLLTTSSGNTNFKKDAFSSVACQALKNYLVTIKPDIVFIPGWSFAIAKTALKWCKKNQVIPLLMSESNEHDSLRIWWKELYKTWIVSKYKAALVGGIKHQEYLNRLGMKSEAIFFGYDVVDNNFFNRDRLNDLAKPNPNPYFLAIGRFIPKKNFLFLLKAYAQYLKKVDTNPWDLILCGNGQLQPQIEQHINKLNLQNKVHLPGFLSPQGLLPYFAHASCFIHPSTTEQWGLVVNEAMAASLPVLVSNRCGCFEELIIEGVNGFGFDPNNSQQLTNLMLQMSLENTDLEKMGKAALEHIQKYSPDYFARGLVQAIKYATANC